MTTAKLPTQSHSPWQLLYGWVLQRRRRYWQKRCRRLAVPVISIGNLHYGGSGKTPLTAAVAGHLRDQGYQVAILSRGYGRSKPGIRVVSHGQGPLVGPGLGGDEPVLLAGMLPGVAVVVGEDRFQAGTFALEALDPSPSLFILDDGFSHLRLARDVDILAFPARRLFAGGRLVPSGRLREPLSAVRYADAVVVTGDEETIEAKVTNGRRFAEALSARGFSGPGFVAPTSTTEVVSVTDQQPRDPTGTKVVAVSAVADDAGFLSNAEDAGANIVSALSYRDHHAYPEASLQEIQRVKEETGAEAILTTAKDAVKLLGRIEGALWEMRIASQPESTFFSWLETRIDSSL